MTAADPVPGSGTVPGTAVTVSTHVLDAALGRPAAGVRVALEVRGADGAWRPASSGETDADGRLRFPGEHLPGGPAVPGLPDSGSAAAPVACRLTFATGAYFAARGTDSFYPEVTVTFAVCAGPVPAGGLPPASGAAGTVPAAAARAGHYHVPLLLSPFAYSTYRGS